MSTFENLTNENCHNYKGIYKQVNKNFYFLNGHGKELENKYEIPKGVRIILFRYSGEILNVCNFFRKFKWSNILLNPNFTSDYCNFLSAISEYKSVNGSFCVYEEGDIINNINLYSDNICREGIFKLPVKGFCYDNNFNSIVISSNTPVSSIVNNSELKYFFKEKRKKIVIDDNKIIDLMKKNNDVSIIESYSRKIYKNIKLSNLVNSMRIHENFTILLVVNKERESNLISNGRKIEDELAKVKREIFIENMLNR